MEQQNTSEALRLFEAAWDEARAAFTTAQDEFADKLANARQTLRSCAGNVEKHKASLEQLTESVAAQLAGLRSMLAEAGDHSALEAKLKNLEQVIEAKEGILAEKDAALAAANEAATAAKAEAEAATQRAEDSQAALKAAQEANTAQAAALEEAKAAAQRAEEAAEAAKMDGATGSERLAALEASEKSLHAELEALKETLAGAQAAEEAAKTAADATGLDLKQARKRLEEAESALGAQEAKAGPLQAEVDALKPQLEALKPQLDAAMAARTAAETEVETLRAALAEAESNASVARAELEQERLRADLSEQKVRDEMSKGTKASLAAQLAEAMQEAEDAREQLHQLRLQYGASPAPPAVNKPTLTAKDEISAVREAVKRAKGQKRTIGDLLVDAGIVSKEQVAQAVDEQRRRPQTHLGAIFVEKTWTSEEAVAQALAYQCGSTYVDLSDGSVDAAAATLVSERLANQHLCIPVSATEDSLALAMANPLDLVAIEDVERASGRKVEVLVGTETQIKAAIGKYYWEP